MKLSDLNHNNVKLGMRSTVPGLHIPTSDSHHDEDDFDDEDEYETDDVEKIIDDIFRNNEIVRSYQQNAPFKDSPDLRSPPNIANIT